MVRAEACAGGVRCSERGWDVQLRSFDLWAMRVDVAKIQHAMIDIAEHVMRDVYSEQKCFVKGICGRKGTDRSADACAEFVWSVPKKSCSDYDGMTAAQQ